LRGTAACSTGVVIGVHGLVDTRGSRAGSSTTATRDGHMHNLSVPRVQSLGVESFLSEGGVAPPAFILSANALDGDALFAHRLSLILFTRGVTSVLFVVNYRWPRCGGP
jgi:hypothetical protein